MLWGEKALKEKKIRKLRITKELTFTEKYIFLKRNSLEILGNIIGKESLENEKQTWQFESERIKRIQ